MSPRTAVNNGNEEKRARGTCLQLVLTERIEQRIYDPAGGVYADREGKAEWFIELSLGFLAHFIYTAY